MQKIRPFLWFDGRAEEAARFYTSIFKNSHLGEIKHYGEAGPGEDGSVMGVSFVLDGVAFMAINGGPEFTFSPAISFFVNCESQAEIDELWAKLADGGATNQCGWLQDKFGVSWQIVPSILGDLLGDQDEAKSTRTMQAMLGMTKLDIAALQRAHDLQSV
jgi:predicted 3-demethylubiquinone-9 3-methyltransferase (glyoxalase superfamily)